MVELSNKQIVEYFHRSYAAVDGLWFMKLEDRDGFEKALEVDAAVWQVMPKIQARKLKDLTGRASGIEALYECFTTKLSVEGYTFTTAGDPREGGFEVAIRQCPWVDLLTRSNRGHLAGTIGERICTAENHVWASEFGADIRFDFGDRLCNGCAQCVMRFTST